MAFMIDLSQISGSSGVGYFTAGYTGKSSDGTVGFISVGEKYKKTGKAAGFFTNLTKVTGGASAVVASVSVGTNEHQGVFYVTSNAKDEVDISKGQASMTVDGSAATANIKVLGGQSEVITTGAGNDTIEVTAVGATVNAGAGADSILVSGDSATGLVDAGAGNDSVYVTGAAKVTVDAGAGNDYVDLVSGATSATVNAGAGNDTVLVAGNGTVNLDSGSNVVSVTGFATINAGTGADKIVVAGKGKSTVLGLGAGDTVDLTKASAEQVLSTALDTTAGSAVSLKGGTDVVVTADSVGTLTLTGKAANVTLGTDNKAIVVSGSADSIYGTSLADAITLTGANNVVAGDTKFGVGDVITISNTSATTNKVGYLTVSGKSAAISVTAGSAAAAAYAVDATGASITSGSVSSATVNATGNDNFISLAGVDDHITVSGTGNTVSGAEALRVAPADGKANDVTIIDSTTGAAQTYTVTSAMDFAEIADDVVSLKSASASLSGSQISIDGSGKTAASFTADSLSVSGGLGDESISVTGSNAVFNLGDGKNMASITGAKGSVTTGAGNDSITVDGTYATVNAGEGDDKVSVNGANAVVNLGADDDTLGITGGYRDVITATSGDNSITGDGHEVSVTTGKGHDTISLTSYYATVAAGEGDNFVSINGHNASVSAGDGDNKVGLVGAAKSNVVLGKGDNSISAAGAHDSNLKTGNGRDTIIADGERVTVTAGNGDNEISLNTNGHDATVSAGTGDDSITVAGNSENAIVAAGDGDNYISIEGHNASITSGAGDDTISVTDDAHDVTLSAGDGDNRIYIDGESANVTTGKGDDSITVTKDAATISAGDGNKLIDGHDADKDFVKVGKGNSQIYLHDDATVTAGAGNDSITVGAQASVNAGDGNNSIVGTGDYSTLIGGTGKDTITANGTAVGIGAGDGNDKVSVDGNYATVISGTGRDTINVNGNDASISTGDGNKAISVKGRDAIVSTGAGNDTISVNGQAGSITAGAGNDVIYGGQDATITAGEGKDTISVNNTGIEFTDYALTTDHIVIEGYNTRTADNLGTDGKITSSDSKDVTISKNMNTYYAAQLYGTDGKHVNYAWVGDDAATIDGSSAGEKFYITGQTNETTGDLLIGTKFADTIYAGENDSVIGGKGRDTINVDSKADVYVGVFTGDGTKTVKNAVVSSVSGSQYDADDTTFYLGSLDGLTAKINGSELDLGLTSAKLDIESVVSSNAAKVKVSSGGKTYNTMVFTGTQTLDDETEVVYGADGTSSNTLVIDSDTDAIDLSNSGNYGDEHLYKNVQVVNASAVGSDIKLVGGAGSTTLVAGSAATSLWGGSAKGDELVGATGGEDTFFYGSGDGRDTVTNYNFNDDDRIYVYTADQFAGVSRNRTTGAVTLKFTNDTTAASQKLTIVNASDSLGADSEYKITTDGKDELIAKVGYSDSINTFTYASDVTFFMGGNSKANVLNVTDGDDAVINLGWAPEFAKNNNQVFDNIHVVNASTSSANVTLTGSTGADTLYASAGESSLWGGTGSDLLVGNASGATTFFFGTGDGKDTISNAGADDRVMLYDVSSVSDLDLNKTGVSGSNLTIALNSGSKVVLAGANDDATIYYNGGSLTVADAKDLFGSSTTTSTSTTTA